MSFEKAIKHKKTRRKPYKGAAQYSCKCRNNGGCGYCEDNRTYKNKKRELKAKLQQKELELEISTDLLILFVYGVSNPYF